MQLREQEALSSANEAEGSQRQSAVLGTGCPAPLRLQGRALGKLSSGLGCALDQLFIPGPLTLSGSQSHCLQEENIHINISKFP